MYKRWIFRKSTIVCKSFSNQTDQRIVKSCWAKSETGNVYIAVVLIRKKRRVVCMTSIFSFCCHYINVSVSNKRHLLCLWYINILIHGNILFWPDFYDFCYFLTRFLPFPVRFFEQIFYDFLLFFQRIATYDSPGRNNGGNVAIQRKLRDINIST